MSMKYWMMLSVGACCAPLTGAGELDAPGDAPQQVLVSAHLQAGRPELGSLLPASVLSGEALHSKLQLALGDILGGELGVAASSFGSAASRPIIRGLDGPRVKVLQNGMDVGDVSSLSNDHAVASETGHAQQIEVLRGPAALLYGSGAIGGVVNVVDGLIPTQAVPMRAIELEARLGDRARYGTSADLDVPLARSGAEVMHLQLEQQHSDDYVLPQGGRLPHTWSRTQGAGWGAGLMRDWGRLGVSLQAVQARYGLPTAEAGAIDMHAQRIQIEGEWTHPWTGVESVSLKGAQSRYRHDELDAEGLAATHFAQNGDEVRLEWRLSPWSAWRPMLGVHLDRQDFSALSAADGRPDTVPQTHSSSRALFVLLERSSDVGQTSVGARLERDERRPLGGQPARSFALRSASLSQRWNMSAQWQLSIGLSHAERAPSAEELYSQGPHDSTETYDVGNAQLPRERSQNLEVSMERHWANQHFKLNLFQNHIRDNVYGAISGVRVDEQGQSVMAGNFALRQWQAADVRWRGYELEWGGRSADGTQQGRLFADAARGALDSGASLPLQPARRVGLEWRYRNGTLHVQGTLIHAFAQSDLAPSEHYVTPAYTQLDLDVSRSLSGQGGQWTPFLQIRNLLNQDIRIASSLLKETVPQPGRTLTVGLRAQF